MNEPAHNEPGHMSQDFGTKSWPKEIRLKKAEKLLEVEFDDGHTFVYPAEFLRVESPSAEVQGHGAAQSQIGSGRKHVGIIELEPVGHYAVRIKFDDLHDTGIYSWAYLHELGQRQGKLWGGLLDGVFTQGPK